MKVTLWFHKTDDIPSYLIDAAEILKEKVLSTELTSYLLFCSEESLMIDKDSYRKYSECYQGCWDNEKDFATNFAQNTNLFDKTIIDFIDWDKYTKSLFSSRYDFYSLKDDFGKHHIFCRI